MSEQQVKVVFKKGIPGFEDIKEYILEMDEGSVYYRLRGEQHPEVGFLLVNPFIFFPDYSFDLDDSSADFLDLQDMADACVFTILTVPKTVSETTANLLAPIVINANNFTGMQVILGDSRYTTKHRVFHATPAAKEG